MLHIKFVIIDLFKIWRYLKIWYKKKKLIKKGKERKLKNENVYNVQNTGGTQKIVIEERRQYI